MAEQYVYPGDELHLFAAATTYKHYSASCLKPFICGDVLEVGCGIGANIPFLLNESVRSWDSLEPDANLLSQVPDAVHEFPIKKINGTTTDRIESKYNTVLYIDVLEHIADDAEEIQRAVALLDMNCAYRGRIIVVSPAHEYLFSNFDKKVGHFRRYTTASLAALAPNGFSKKIFYIDSVGYFLSLANRFLLHQSIPTRRQIAFWDTVIIPLSKVVDRILHNTFGKTIVAVFEKELCS